MPTPLRRVSAHATNVLPVPTNGSRTICPLFVKNSMKSVTISSGNFAGCWTSSSFRGAGLQTNHDFVNLIHSFPVSSFSVFEASGPSFREDLLRLWDCLFAGGRAFRRVIRLL